MLRKIGNKRIFSVMQIILFIYMAVFVYGIGIKAKVAEALDNNTKYRGYIENHIKQWVNNNYSYYYNVNEVDVDVEAFSVNEDKIEGIAKVCVNKVLKAKKISELPYIKGMLKKINIDDYDQQLEYELKAKKIYEANKDSLSSENVEKAINILDDKYSELKEYIGKADDSYMILKFEAKLDKNGVIDKTIRLYAEQMNIFIPADDLIPKNPQEYEDAGYREMEEALNAVKARVVVNPSLYSGYDRIKARDYANTWTSNTSNYCPHGKALQDTSKWNNTKWPYQSSLCHNDCADYVSQSLNAGGIPVDPGKWERFKDSSNNWAWTYVPGLKNYMLNQKSYWKPSTWESAAAGGVIVIPNSHVMMIVKNDTIERLFSAHTNDRLKYPYAKNTSWEYYILW